jgi:hypothetical protein
MIIPRPYVREPPAPSEERSIQEAERREATAVRAVPLVTSDDDESTDNATEDRNAKWQSQTPDQRVVATHAVKFSRKGPVSSIGTENRRKDLPVLC